MRVEMFGLAVAASVLFTGDVPGLNGVLTRETAPPPAWLSIPANADISTMKLTGGRDSGQLSGSIVIRPGSNTAGVVEEMARGLARNGFQLSQRRIDGSIGRTRAMITAINAEKGRRASVTVLASFTGTELHIDFAAR